MRVLNFMLLLAGLQAASGALEQTNVFTRGQDGYHTFRIPSMVVTAKGTVLAICEGRRNGGGDSGVIDLVLKRSEDNGRSWGPLRPIYGDGTNTWGNPCAIVDRQTGTIWLLVTHNLGTDKEAAIIAGTSVGARTVWSCFSTNDGLSWTQPVELTSQAKRPDWTWYATGPGIGIQMRNGTLVVPCNHVVVGTRANYSHLLLSTNHGTSWVLGGEAGPGANESQVVELSDGSLLLNMRSYRGKNTRLTAVSKDGGFTFSELRDEPALVEPVCQGSILRFKFPAEGKPGVILFSNPASKKREKLTVRASTDDGGSWTGKELYPGPAAYSCLAALADGSAACFYERGEKSPYEAIVFARFPLEWITHQNESEAR